MSNYLIPIHINGVKMQIATIYNGRQTENICKIFIFL